MTAYTKVARRVNKQFKISAHKLDAAAVREILTNFVANHPVHAAVLREYKLCQPTK